MARSVNGVSTILAASRVICKMVKRFGVIPLASRTSGEFAAAVAALAIACDVLDQIDDFVNVIDRTAGGSGVNDEDIPILGQTGTLENEKAG